MILGLFLLLAFWVSLFLLWRQARANGINEEKIIDLSLLIPFVGFIGGRAVYVFQNLETFGQSIVRILLILKYPGISIIGAVISSVFAIIVLSKIFKMKIVFNLDLFSLPVFVFGLTVMTGCFVQKCQDIQDQNLPIGYLLLLLFLAFLFRLKGYIVKHFEVGKVLNKPGFFAAIIGAAGICASLGLAKNLTRPVYFSMLIILTALVFILGFRHKELFKMIKIPDYLLHPIATYLEQKKKDAEKQLAELKKEDPNSDKGRLHQEMSDDDVASDKAKHESVSALQAQLNKTLVQLRKALTMIKLGKYGMCESCGNLIDTDRLAAMPTATLCLKCEKKRESK